MTSILVLRGPVAGQVWWMEEDDWEASPLFHPDTGEPFDFLDWYELWLDRALCPGRQMFRSYALFLQKRVYPARFPEAGRLPVG